MTARASDRSGPGRGIQGRASGGRVAAQCSRREGLDGVRQGHEGLGRDAAGPDERAPARRRADLASRGRPRERVGGVRHRAR